MSNICRHCDQPSGNISRHERVCLANPDVANLVKKCLRDWSRFTIVSQMVYDQRVKDWGLGIPAALTIRTNLQKSWAEVAEWAGVNVKQNRLEYTQDHLRHLSHDLHDGITGPSRGEYMTHYDGVAYSAQQLRLTLKAVGWEDVLSWAGLRHGTRGYYRGMSAARSLSADEELCEYIADCKRAMSDTGSIVGTPQQKRAYDWQRRVWRIETVYVLK